MNKARPREQKQLGVLLDLEELMLTKTWRTVHAEVEPTIGLARQLAVQPTTHQAMPNKRQTARSTTVAMMSTLTEPTEHVKALQQSLI